MTASTKASLSTLVAFALAAVLPGAAFPGAVASELTQAQASPGGSNAWDRPAWRVFGGGGLGYGGVASEEFRDGPSGGQYLALGSFGRITPSWVLEGGLGWAYSRIEGKDALGRGIWIRTRSGLAEASARYRLSERWQLGPVAAVSFGADTTQSPSLGRSRASVQGGLRGAYEMPWGRFALRVFEQVTVDLTVPDRRFAVALVGLQLGLPIGGGGASPSAADPGPPRIDEITTGSAAPERQEEIRIVLDPQRVFFKTNSAGVRPTVRQALREIGAYVVDHPGACREIAIAGHADRRGSYQYNLALSRRRAESVRQAIAGGADHGKEVFKVEAFGYTAPVDRAQTPLAWARNRRVELVFRGVTRPAELRARLESLKMLTERKP